MPNSGPLTTLAVRWLVIICLAGAVFASCASTSPYPDYPPPTAKDVQAGFDDTFNAVLEVLREDARLELHTIDKAGRFVAREKVSGFIFFRHRTVIDIVLEPIGPEETTVTMKLKAQDYNSGGLTREAGWYPSSRVDSFLGEDIMNLIDARVAQTSS